MPMHQPKRLTTIRKYLAIQKRHDHLFNVERLRRDDVIRKLMEEFFIADETTIYRIIATTVKEPPEEIQLKDGRTATIQKLIE